MCSQWLQLLVGVVAFKQGLLQELLACLPFQEAALHGHDLGRELSKSTASGSSSSSGGVGMAPAGQQEGKLHGGARAAGMAQQDAAPLAEGPVGGCAQHRGCQGTPQQQEAHERRQGGPQGPAAFTWSHHTPVLLHILAHEVEHMVGVGAAPADREECGSGGSSGSGASAAAPAAEKHTSCAGGGTGGSSSGASAAGPAVEERGSGGREGAAGIIGNGGRQSGSGGYSSRSSSGGVRRVSGGAGCTPPWLRALRCVMAVAVAASAQCRAQCSAEQAGGERAQGVPPVEAGPKDGATGLLLAKHVLEAALEVRCAA